MSEENTTIHTENNVIDGESVVVIDDENIIDEISNQLIQSFINTFNHCKAKDVMISLDHVTKAFALAHANIARGTISNSENKQLNASEYKQYIQYALTYQDVYLSVPEVS